MVTDAELGRMGYGPKDREFIHRWGGYKVNKQSKKSGHSWRKRLINIYLRPTETT